MNRCTHIHTNLDLRNNINLCYRCQLQFLYLKFASIVHKLAVSEKIYPCYIDLVFPTNLVKMTCSRVQCLKTQILQTKSVSRIRILSGLSKLASAHC